LEHFLFFSEEITFEIQVQKTYILYLADMELLAIILSICLKNLKLLLLVEE